MIGFPSKTQFVDAKFCFLFTQAFILFLDH